MSNILVIGATSAIAQAAARIYATRGNNLCLLGRNETKLSLLADELRTLGAGTVSSAVFNAEEPAAHGGAIEKAINSLGTVDVALLAHGDLVAQADTEASWEASQKSLTINLVSAVAFLVPLANYFAERGCGNITVISSVAGDRGRASNYSYGAAKAGLSAYVQGLRNRLAREGVSVTTIKPGFVDTPMTAHLKKGALFATAETVGKRIVKASDRGEDIVYTPWFWRFIMAIIIHIPERIFKKLSL